MAPVTQATAAGPVPGRLMILDSATLYYRAFYALPESMTAPDGRPHNAIRGFCDFVTRLVTVYKPAGLVCAWDADWRPEFRVKAWPAYKAHRLAEDGSEAEPDTLTPQVEGLASILDSLGVCRLGHRDFEADDIVATTAAHAVALGFSGADIVTSDRDMLQCVDDTAGIVLLSIAKGLSNIEAYDEAAILAKYGIRASQYLDFATMRGDASDGLPGIAGIGEKTAASLLGEFHSLAHIRAAAAEPTSSLKPGVRNRILAAEPILDALTAVSTVVRNVPLGEVWPDLPISVHDDIALQEWCSHWGVGSSVSLLRSALTKPRT